MARRVTIVGVGGIGSWLAEGIARMLEYRDPGSFLILVDGDAFEPKNAERQHFSQMGNKADVKATELGRQFTRIFPISVPKWVVSNVPAGDEEVGQKITTKELMESGDVIFAVTDNFAARKLIIDEAKQLDDVDVFLGGNDDQLFGSVYHYQRRGGKDITDSPDVWHPEYDNPPDRNPGEMSCQDRAAIEGGTQLIAINKAVAAVLEARFHLTILEGQDPTTCAEIFMDWGLGKADAFDRNAATPAEESVNALA